MTWPFAPPSSDAANFDALCDALATDPDREFSRPSLFPTCRAFVAATSVAGISSPATRSANAKAEPDTTGGGPLSPSSVVSPSLEGLPDE